MCLIAFSVDQNPRYKVILAANRDEFYNRPTRKAQFWEKEGFQNILAGKDLEAGGTWMGINRNGKWAALTNYRDPKNIKENAPSRGDLVLDYLKNDLDADSYIKKIEQKAGSYNGFNILLGKGSNVLHFSNENELVTKLPPGFHGVSNALLDTSWPKLNAAKTDLKQVTLNGDFDNEDLFTLLKNDAKADDKMLPSTGIPYEWEKAISSVFIKTENYGTLCSTLLLIDHYGNAEFIERRYDAQTSNIIEENAFELVFS